MAQNQGEQREEPTLTVYIVDTEEKKEMKLEEYLEGVVAGEMEADWPEEAYAAQAILARSFTVNWLDANKKSQYGTDISTDVEEAQAYNPEAITDTIKAAVERTRGEVLTYNGKVIKGWFHSYSGGQTASAKEGLNYQGEEPEYITSIDLPENEYVPEELKSWTVELEEDTVMQALSKLGADVGTIEEVKIGETGPSNRAITLIFVGSEGQTEVSAPEFRIAVDPKVLKSLLLTEVSWADGTLTMSGSGFGHGVGLSQWDAYRLAKEGASPEEIVRKFFPKATIKRLWE